MPYLTPNSIPEGDDCRPLSIPASTDWLAFFGGALTELTKTYNWQQGGAITVEQTVAKMQEIIDNWYTQPCNACTTPGGYRIIRIGTGGHLEQLNSEGEWEPATDEYYIPPPAAREGGTEPEQKCLAAKNAVNVLEQLYEELSEAWASHLSEAEALTDFIALAIALVGFEFAPISFAIAAFFFVVFRLLYDALEYLGADLWTEDFSNQLVCFLLDCAVNTAGVVTFDWDCFNNHLNSLADSFGLSEEQLRLYAQVGYMLYFIGGGDALNLAGATTEITDADCDDCNAPWCRYYDFRLDPYQFIPQGDGATSLAFWSSGVGWTSVVSDAPSAAYRLTAIAANFAAHITSLEMVFDYTQGVCTTSGDAALDISSQSYEDRFATVIVCDVPVSPAEWCAYPSTPGEPVDVTQLLIQLIAGIDPSHVDPGGEAVIVSLKVQGVGTPPPGGEICEWVECP